MQHKNIFKISFPVVLFFLSINILFCQKLKLNDLEYFETTGLNVLVFSNHTRILL